MTISRRFLLLTKMHICDSFAQFPTQQGSILSNRFAEMKANVCFASDLGGGDGDARQRKVRCKTI